LTGRFITLEGIEGVGKSTNLEYVAEWLRDQGKTVVVTREPGGTPVAEQIRSVILDSDRNELPPLSELLLMFAARAAHLEALVSPALARGEWVVCDRFTDSSFAYQGAGRGLPMETIALLDDQVLRGQRPDLTILLDLPLEESVRRRADRTHRDRFELEQDAFFARVRAGYLEIAERERDRVQLVDAGRPIEEVQAEIVVILGNFLNRISNE
jgi:dTMP kinase